MANMGGAAEACGGSEEAEGEAVYGESCAIAPEINNLTSLRRNALRRRMSDDKVGL